MSKFQSGNPLINGLDPTPAPALNCTNNCTKKTNIAVMAGASVGGLVGLILVIIIAIVAYRRCNCTPPTPSGNRRKSAASRAKAYTFAEVYAATNQLNQELRKGGFGPVYDGKLPDGKEVAVKVADGSTNQGEREFFNEKQIPIDEYMSNSSLFDILHGRLKGVVTQDLRMRLNIALNATQGLEYLHTGCSPSIIH